MEQQTSGAAPRGRTLQQKMTAMLAFIVVFNLLFSGAVIFLGAFYMQGFNQIMNDCYAINHLLGAYSAESDALDAYVLYGEIAYADYLSARSASNRAMEQLAIPYEKAQEQHLLLEAVTTSYGSFRAACDETVLKIVAGDEYAAPYDTALRIGQYIEGYIKSLLQLAIEEGQVVYQRNMVQFRFLPLLYGLGIALSFLAITLWTRWMMRHVVTPLNALIAAAGALSENQYDTPDLVVFEQDEIAQLSRLVNEMKHSTVHLLDSLRAQLEMEMRSLRMEATMDTLRLSLLQSQINPHFLFNTLNIISRMAQMEEAPKTEELILRLANLFRYNLQSVDDIVPLENELRIVSDYIAIQQIRFGERIAFSLALDVDPADYTVPVFTLQPLIENAVIHGISPMEEGGTITVSIRREADRLCISVSDTGVGMTPGQVEALLSRDVADRQHVSGLGLGSVRARIAAHYPGSRFVIDSQPGRGTEIRITIPLEEEEVRHG